MAHSGSRLRVDSLSRFESPKESQNHDHQALFAAATNKKNKKKDDKAEVKRCLQKGDVLCYLEKC